MIYRIKEILLKNYLLLLDLIDYVCSLGHSKVRDRIIFINAGGLDGVHGQAQDDDFFLAMTTRINTKERQEIFRVTAGVTLEHFKNDAVPVEVLDASDEEFLLGNKKIIADLLPESKINYQAQKLRQAPSLMEIFSGAPKKKFLLFYDDQPIIGLSGKFLQAVSRVVEDFKGFADLVFINDIDDYGFDDDQKTIECKTSNLAFNKINNKPLGIVKYGDYTFAVLKNKNYGFFFNTIFAFVADYQSRLQWFISNVSDSDSNLIELAGMKRRGPSYKYVVVPLEVFMINLDYSHSENSCRDYSGLEKQAFEKINNGYKIRVDFDYKINNLS